jgi:hypothetical protein
VETCVKNGHPHFHGAVAASDLWTDLLRLATDPVSRVRLRAQGSLGKAGEVGGEGPRFAAHAQTHAHARRACLGGAHRDGWRATSRVPRLAQPRPWHAAPVDQPLQVDAEVRDKILGMVEDFSRVLPQPQYKDAYGSMLVRV